VLEQTSDVNSSPEKEILGETIKMPIASMTADQNSFMVITQKVDLKLSPGEIRTLTLQVDPININVNNTHIIEKSDNKSAELITIPEKSKSCTNGSILKHKSPIPRRNLWSPKNRRSPETKDKFQESAKFHYRSISKSQRQSSSVMKWTSTLRVRPTFGTPRDSFSSAKKNVTMKPENLHDGKTRPSPQRRTLVERQADARATSQKKADAGATNQKPAKHLTKTPRASAPKKRPSPASDRNIKEVSPCKSAQLLTNRLAKADSKPSEIIGKKNSKPKLAPEAYHSVPIKKNAHRESYLMREELCRDRVEKTGFDGVAVPKKIAKSQKAKNPKRAYKFPDNDNPNMATTSTPEYFMGRNSAPTTLSGPIDTTPHETPAKNNNTGNEKILSF
jgi:hypothetical protein